MLQILSIILMFLPVACVQSSPIKVTAAPQKIYIEKDDFGQFINFDFELKQEPRAVSAWLLAAGSRVG